VLKDISADLLIGCIRDVLAGKTYLAPSAAAKLAEGVTHVQLDRRREMATLRLMADGKANKESREPNSRSASGRSKTHLGHLFEKLGVAEPNRSDQGRHAGRGLVRLQ